MDDQNKNLILATALSLVVIMAWYWIFPPAKPPVAPQTQGQVTQTTPGKTAQSQTTTAPAAPAAGTAATPTPGHAAKVAENAPRVKIDTPKLYGTISLLGGRIDDLSLKDYRQTAEKDSPHVRLLSPVAGQGSYYAYYGWVAQGGLDAADVPGVNTLWTAPEGAVLTPDHPITLTWDNGKGLTFSRTISVDDNYMFNVTQKVTNAGADAVQVAPYGIVQRRGTPPGRSYYLLFEGAYQMANGTLNELSWKSMTKLEDVTADGAHTKVLPDITSGWTGLTSKYFMTAMIPDKGRKVSEVADYTKPSDTYRVGLREGAVSVAPGASATSTSRLFAGAKVYDVLKAYQNDAGVPRFIDAIDWGWFFFFTKPIFLLLHALHSLIGNMGVAIICLTLILKVLVLPLAYKSYVSMARMKELQPEIEALKERAGDDRAKMQKEMMQLYKEKKVNPAAGCLPIFIQVPIFFSLYKVIYVTIELRQAPFIGWIRDLSQPDPSSLFNFFGLLPWPAPEHGTMLASVFIGLMPILLGITMWLQQKLNPAPADATQKMIFAWMPWVFMFMLGSFPSGLVLYWITNNTTTFTQQYLIMRSHGHKPDVFGNIMATFRRGGGTKGAKAANTAGAPKGGKGAKDGKGGKK